MVRVFGRRLPLAFRARMRLEGRHPRKPPHWYLAIMGVAPESQGRGMGSKLMHPALADPRRTGHSRLSGGEHRAQPRAL